MNRARSIALAAVGLLSLSPPAAADEGFTDMQTWNLLCSPNGIACGSWHLQITYDPNAATPGFTGRTTITGWIQNLQGAPGREAISPFQMAALSVDVDWTEPSWRPNWNGPASLQGVGDSWLISSRTGERADRPRLGWEYSLSNRFGFYLVSPVQASPGVWGCDAPVGVIAGLRAHTCGEQSRFNISLWVPGKLSFADGRGSNPIILGGPGISPCPECVVVPVPEPGTALLMLLGLVGFGTRLRQDSKRDRAREPSPAA